MIKTIRKDIIEILEKEKHTVKQLSDYFGVPVADIIEDLKHIRQTLKPMHRKLVEQNPLCKHCGFDFRNREKLSRPSRCPRCRSEDITEPVFWVE